ncbi:MAG: tryptophan--tRNA ligase [Patescibacteria group bacterium]|jgi:tryptophanyl-tRNA synthetase
MNTKLRVFSGIQPSGQLHIGNYLGAIKQWIPLQSTNDCLFCVVDYHAITVKYDPKDMRNRTLNAALDYLAAGLDPKRATLFVQSHVPEHTELAWLLNTITPVGELRRMTQWKEKSGIKDIRFYNPSPDKKLHSSANFQIQLKGFRNTVYNKYTSYLLMNLNKSLGKENDNKEYNKIWETETGNLLRSKEFTEIKNNIVREYEEETLNKADAGLLNYPVLMAADILLYHTNIVPVGEDQQQHVELARVIARKFNHQFGQTFIEPTSQLSESKRIMSLADPSKKMSKSLGPKHFIALTDSPAIIREKVSKAVTDTGSNEGELSPGIKNLFLLLKEFGTTEEYRKFDAAYRDKSIRYSDLKSTLAEAIIRTLKPFQAKRAALAKSPKKIWQILDDGAKRARPIAQKTLRDVKVKMGLV